MPRSHAFGRLPAPDDRDKAFQIRPLLAARPTEPLRRSRFWWAQGWWGDQDVNPWCVDFAWHHWTVDGPLTHRRRGTLWTPGDVYFQAQRIDEWDGEGYDGTSVRAGAKVLQRLGYIESYHWAWDVWPVVEALLTVGPVVVGTNWHRAMTFPNAAGLVKPEGPVEGGHAYLLNGVNLDTGLIRIKNSWGRSWGRRGFATISIEDMDELIRADGEACLAIEKRPAA